MSKIQSVMSKDFSRNEKPRVPRSTFDRSHGLKTTFDAGDLIPIYVDEALPADTFNAKLTAFARLATPVAPFMDNLYLDSFFFSVPIRLIWDNWQKFNGEQKNPADSTDYLIPQMVAPSDSGYAVGSLSDYFAIPTGVKSLSHSSLYHRAYNLIWNEWFRDENLQDSVVVDLDDGPDDPDDYVLLKRGKRYDYFTSCLPWPQKGPSVDLPLGSSAPITGLGIHTQGFNDLNIPVYETDGTSSITYPKARLIGDSALHYYTYVQEDPDNSGYPNIRADLSDASAATINQLRLAFQIQTMYERDALGGSRYVEIIRAHFGVNPSDARLQRPEYLGGGTTPINVNPIAQTSSTDDASPQGNLAAMATASIRNHGFTKTFEEHCIVLGFVCARADLNYQQGLSRDFSRRTRFDYYWPSLSNIGEQAVLNKEIFAQGTDDDDEPFGYQERYAEYRFKPSNITGKFRSTYAQSLDFWHLAQDFETLPTLSADFIVENPPLDRVLAVTDEPQFLYDSYIKLICARPMPRYSTPAHLGKF
ncbi:major capsid protein [Microviridae sp.]|nr:major capsid protein [Microviridae sp.]